MAGSYNIKLGRKEADAQDLAIELAEHGRHALELRDLALAKRTLPLGHEFV